MMKARSTGLYRRQALYAWKHQFGGCTGLHTYVSEPLMIAICGSDSDYDEGRTYPELADGKRDHICASEAYAALDNGFNPLDFEPTVTTLVPGDGLTENLYRKDEQYQNRGHTEHQCEGRQESNE